MNYTNTAIPHKGKWILIKILITVLTATAGILAAVIYNRRHPKDYE